MAQPVEFPGTTAFDLMPAAVWVPTINTMEACWIAVGAVPYLPLYSMADVDTELIQMRRVAFLPFVAVPCYLTLLSMRQLWTILGQPLINGGQEVEMGLLLNWIQVASVSSAAQVSPVIQLAVPPVTPLADTCLLNCLHQVVRHWLPGLGAPAPIPQVAVQALQVLGILQQLLDDQCMRHQAEEARWAGAA